MPCAVVPDVLPMELASRRQKCCQAQLRLIKAKKHSYLQAKVGVRWTCVISVTVKQHSDAHNLLRRLVYKCAPKQDLSGSCTFSAKLPYGDVAEFKAAIILARDGWLRGIRADQAAGRHIQLWPPPGLAGSSEPSSEVAR